jgi:hypothetical protein
MRTANQYQRFTVVLAANGNRYVPATGRFLHIYSISVASCQIAFDREAPQVIYPGVGVKRDVGFSGVTFVDSLGGGCTIEAAVSDDEILDSRNSGFAAAMAASLAAIDADTTLINASIGTSNGHLANVVASLAAIDGDTDALADIVTLLDVRDNPLDIIPQVIPISGGAPSEVQIVTGAAINRVVCLRALDTNVGDVWLRFHTGVSNLLYSVPLHAGDSWREEHSGDVFACSQNGTEALCGYVTRI